ncbi:hypothetical protein EUGRSUZ_E03897 [Eucalyptus grandis]|uniref:Uncharacterized protein n=2 Tax=Eucalyptus grandis TaxID=71139 RepID=A0ACC3L0R6_EUCGR|nr:hypothetical protein EUGRSUZ_E03897 [Eucalyptus grandis]
MNKFDQADCLTTFSKYIFIINYLNLRLKKDKCISTRLLRCNVRATIDLIHLFFLSLRKISHLVRRQLTAPLAS